MVKLKSLVVTMVVATAFFGLAIFGAEHAYAGACDKSPETTKITVMADWLAWAVQAPVLSAIQNGYYKDEGLEVELIQPAQAADPIRLVAAEKVQFTMTYVPEVLMARDADIPVVSIAVVLRPLPSALMVLPDSGIKGPADLKGKTLGVNPIPLMTTGVKTLLATAGLTMDDVKVVDPGYGVVALLMAGKVDAGWALTYAEGMVATEALAKEGKPPVEFLMYRDYGVPDYYFEVLAANENWLKINAATTCRFLRATTRGFETYEKNPEPMIKWMAEENEVFTIEQHRKIVELTMADWTDEDGNLWVQDVKIWAETQDWLVEEGLLSAPADPESYFTNAYLP